MTNYLLVSVVGDLYQLPPIRQSTVFSPFKNDLLNFCRPWKIFNFYELTETMREQGDYRFVNLLNNVRIGTLAEDDHLALLKKRQKDDCELPSDTVFIYAENSLKDDLNASKLAEISHSEIRIPAIDKIPTGIPKSKLDKIAELNQSQTGGLAQCLVIKKDAKVMLTNNIDIDDRLINGQLGKIF